MERASGLMAAEVSQRLLGIGLHTIASHPWAYVKSSLRQVPEFWQAPDYGVELRRHITSLFHLIVRAQHWLNELDAILFALLCAGAAAARLLLRRRGLDDARAWGDRSDGLLFALSRPAFWPMATPDGTATSICR